MDLSYSQPSISVSLLIIINRHDALNLVANLLSFASVILSDAGPISTGFSKLGNKDEDAVTVKLAYEQILDQVCILPVHHRYIACRLIAWGNQLAIVSWNNTLTARFSLGIHAIGALQ